MHDFDKFQQDMANRPDPPRNEPTFDNMFQYSHERIIENCTVITLDGINGFMWIDPDGVRHNEGMLWPTMRIEQGCTVQILSDEYGRESKGWYKDGTEI